MYNHLKKLAKSILIKSVKLTFLAICFISCQNDQDSPSGQSKKEIWIYTSMYKDTISELSPLLEKKFPQFKINFYQAGSEEVATKVNAEILSGKIQADLLISSDRFWYEDMARQKLLHPYKVKVHEKIPESLIHSEGFYHALSIPVMVICYNQEGIDSSILPKKFKDLINPKLKDLVTFGSPLASGTNFSTMAMLQASYGWDYFKNLKSNNAISEGGNSSVLRRIQNKERPIGWVLLENVLRFQNTDKRLKVIFPEDGVITQSNMMAITKKSDQNRKDLEEIADWFYSNEGQEVIVNSFMYSPLKHIRVPTGAPPYDEMMVKSFPWRKELVDEIVLNREKLKEEFTKIMFQ